MVITEADGAASEARRVAGELHAALADDAVAVHAPEDAAEVAELWRWRSSVAFAILAQRGGAFSEDIAVPLDRLRDVARETLALGERHGIPALSFGHAGDGNIHSTFLFSPTTPTRPSAPTPPATSSSSWPCHSEGRSPASTASAG